MKVKELEKYSDIDLNRELKLRLKGHSTLLSFELKNKPNIRKEITAKTAEKIASRFILPVKNRSGKVEAFFVDKKANINELKKIRKHEIAEGKIIAKKLAYRIKSEKISKHVVYMDKGCFLVNGELINNFYGDGCYNVTVYKFPEEIKQYPREQWPEKLSKAVVYGARSYKLVKENGQELDCSNGMTIQEYDCDIQSQIVAKIKDIELAFIVNGNLKIWVK